MPVNEHLSHVSNLLFATAIAVYSLALVCFTAEWAFGRRGKVAVVAASTPAAPARVLAGSGGPELVEAAVPPLGESGGPTLVEAGGQQLAGTGGQQLGGTAAADLGGADRGASVPGERSDVRGSAADRFGRAAMAVTILGALAHLASIALRAGAVDRVPWGNMYEFSSLAGLIAVIAFVAVLYRLPQLRHLGGFVLFPVVVLMFLAGTVLYAQASPLVPALQSYWLAIHVSLVSISEGVLMTSAVMTMLLMIRQRHDRLVAAGRPLRFPFTIGARLPAPASIDKAAYRAVAFAFPLYTIGIICGAIWAEAAWGRYWGWDPKETWAFIGWVIYAAYLHARATAGWRYRAANWINLLGFGALTFNFFVVNIVIAGLHSYAGLN